MVDKKIIEEFMRTRKAVLKADEDCLLKMDTLDTTVAMLMIIDKLEQIEKEIEHQDPN